MVLGVEWDPKIDFFRFKSSLNFSPRERHIEQDLKYRRAISIHNSNQYF